MEFTPTNTRPATTSFSKPGRWLRCGGTKWARQADIHTSLRLALAHANQWSLQTLVPGRIACTHRD